MTQNLKSEAKALVALAFRNGPIEDLHSGVQCLRCGGQQGYSRISDLEMKSIMKSAVDCVYRLLALKGADPAKYARQVEFGARCATDWDDPC